VNITTQIVFSERSKETDLASHVHRELSKAASISQRRGHEGICGLLLLLGVAGDGVSIEVNVKDKSFWLCHPSALSVYLHESQRQDPRDYLWLFSKWHCILWEYPERAHAYKRGEPECSEIRRTSWL
jgi:hypothetical protein